MAGVMMLVKGAEDRHNVFARHVNRTRTQGGIASDLLLVGDSDHRAIGSTRGTKEIVD
jgi:hypothetical protein